MREQALRDSRGQARGSAHRPRRLGSVVINLLLWLAALVAVIPFVAALGSSLKTYSDFIQVPPQWLPNPVNWSNYAEVWDRAPFAVFALNSLMVSGLAVVGAVLTSSLVGHALARMRLPGKDVLLVAALGTLMLPTVITIVPSFVLYKQLGFLDTLTPLVLPYWLATPFGIFVMRQAFLAIPKDFEEAAVLDGANPWQVFRRIHMPLVKPAAATVGVFTFMTTWSAVLEPTIYLTSQERYTLPLGVLSLQGQFVGDGQLVTAAALMSLLPMLVLFLLAQRFFVSGGMSAGIKG